MKPLQLTMQAFGSYGNATVIDFTKPDQNLFLITGDTGAGKSTIFDAIVFALYGEASSTSNVKRGAELQSQFVSPETEPYVELIFTETEGGVPQEYTVRRVPQHVRPYKRGRAGVVSVGEGVELTLPAGQPFVGNIRETNARLVEIVGLSKAQFVQVAMIAQGEFMELLRADSQDKKVIFRKLFGTELYGRITEELKTRREKEDERIAALEHGMIAEAGHVIVPEPEAGELRDLQGEILRGGGLSARVLESFVAGLEQLCAHLGELQKNASSVYKKARKERDARRDAVQAAENLAVLYQQLDAAQAQLRECEALEERNIGKQRMRREILASHQIRGEYLRCEAAEKAAAETESNLEAQEKALPGLAAAREEAAAAEKKASETASAEAEACSKIEEKVQRALQTYLQLAEMERKAETARRKQTAALQQSKEARTALQELEKQEKEWRTRLEAYRDLERRRAEWTFRKGEGDGIRADLSAAMEERGLLQKQFEEKNRLTGAYEKVSGEYAAANEKYEGLRRAYLDAQAGLLARELKPGTPCPVCGSTTHPHPCVLTGAAGEISREALEKAEKEAATLRDRQEQSAAASHAAGELYKEKRAHLSDTMDRLRARMSAQIGEVPADAEIKALVLRYNEWLADLKEQDGELKRQEQDRDQLRLALEGIDGRREKLRAADEKASSEATAAAEELAGRLSALEQLRGALEYPGEGQARQELKAARDARDLSARNAQKAAKQLQDALRSEERSKALIRQFTEELPAKRDERNRLRRAYEAVLSEHQMAEGAWKDIVQRWQLADAERLQQEIDAFSRRKVSAEGSLKTAQEAIGGRERPALKRLSDERDAAEQALQAAEKQHAELGGALSADRTALDRIAPAYKEWAQHKEARQRLYSLYLSLAGRNRGARMDIETFVQRYYLERILDAANARFLEMSAGQFELRMVDLDRAGEGRNRGLDLMVYSNVTGREREVRTLSGGESFMAALSLALGMADQIRESAADVNLDILFIDEGFGSLDNHSRDQAVKVLQQMAGGSRLIGIISHVTEMKQEIDDQLIVTKDDAGSHVRWVLS